MFLLLAIVLAASEPAALCPGKQLSSFCHPFPYTSELSSREKDIFASYYTFPEPMPADLGCVGPDLCLVARIGNPVQAVTLGPEPLFQAFELVLANPGRKPMKLVFSGSLEILREAFNKTWLPVEAGQCPEVACGNSSAVVILRPGYCYRFHVPVYGGSTKIRQRFHARLETDALPWPSVTELYSNEFESTISFEQFLVDPKRCELPPLVDTSR